MTENITQPDPKKSLKYGWQIAIIYFTIGLSLVLFEVMFYGWTMFVALPFIVGLSAGLLPSKKYGLYGVYIGLIAFCIFLLLGHFEGLVCLIYTLPIAWILILLGYAISKYIRKKTDKNPNTLKFVIVPLIVLSSSTLIEYLVGNSKIEDSVSTSMSLPYSPDKVWDFIKSVDTLASNRSFWLKIGLPVPLKCVLESETIGAKRTCYFEGGYIEEELTEIKKPVILKMKVTNYKLKGRHWLSFKDAIYTFSQKVNGTVITRTTTYFSELKPRFYWKLCEHHAIESEHDYVLNNLKIRLDNNK